MTKSILIIEDDQWSAELYAQRLQLEGYYVQHVRDLSDAWAALSDKSFDVVLLDILLGEYNGLQLLHELRADASLSLVPVIIVSSVDVAEIGLPKAVLQAYGVADILHKGVHRPRDVVRAVQRASRV